MRRGKRQSAKDLDRGQSRPRGLAWLRVWAAALGLASAGWALDPSVALDRLGLDLWDGTRGLPQDTVFAVRQTRDGYVWIATQGGLARFDGSAFTVFDPETVPALRVAFFTSLFEDSAGRLWIGTRGQGAVLYSGGRFQTLGGRQGWGDWVVSSFAEDRAGALWIGTADRGLFRWDGRRLARLTTREGLPENRVYGLAAAPDGSIWIGTGRGLARWKEGRLTAYGSARGGSDRLVRAVLRSRDGTVWAGGVEGLFRLQGERLDKVGEHGGVAALFEDGSGTLWIGSNSEGLLRRRSGRIEAWRGDPTLAAGLVQALAEDRERGLWVGTGASGVGRLRETQVQTLGAAEGLAGGGPAGVDGDGQGAVWLGVDGGPVRVRDGRIEPVPFGTAIPGGIGTLALDRQGGLWVAPEKGGLLRRLAGKVRHFGRADGLPDGTVRVLFVDSGGALWAGTALRGVARFDGRRFVPLDHDFGFNTVYAMAETPDGALWVAAGGRGLLRVGCVARPGDGPRRRYSLGSTLSANTVFSLLVDSSGDLWAGTLEGLRLLRGDRFLPLTRRHGLPANMVHSLLEDGRGDLWIGGERGLAHAPLARLKEAALRRRVVPGIDLLGAAEGLRDPRCAGARQPSAWRAPDGRLWFAMATGVAIVDPAALRRNPVPPPVAIESFLADRRRVPLAPVPRLPSATRDYEIHYTGLSFAAPGKVRFRYRLEGFDRAWVDAGARRAAYYTNLPPGDYTFRVAAANGDGVWSDREAVFRFRRLPRFRETALFPLLLAALAALALWGLHRLRIAVLRARFAAILAERGRLAREVHDTLAQGLTGIGFQLEAAGADLPPGGERLRSRLDRAGELVRSSLDEVRRSVFALWPEGLGEGGLAEALRALAERTAEDTGIDVRFERCGEVPRWAAAVEREVLRVAQEAVTNAVRHARAGRVTVALCGSPTTLRLAVSDDGIGLGGAAPDREPGGGFGLPGMRERARAIGASLRLGERLEGGTRVELELAAPRAARLRARGAAAGEEGAR